MYWGAVDPMGPMGPMGPFGVPGNDGTVAPHPFGRIAGGYLVAIGISAVFLSFCSFFCADRTHHHK